MCLFWIFFPRTKSSEGDSSDAEISDHGFDESNNHNPTETEATIVIFVSIFFIFFCVVGSVFVRYLFPASMRRWADVLGVGGGLLAMTQYIPQIRTTYKAGKVASLSIPMMCIQTPGSFVFAFSLWLRLGWLGWSSWGIFVVTGVLQGCLLIMGLSYELKAYRTSKKARTQSATHPSDEPDEETPLLTGARDAHDSNQNVGH